MCGMGRGKGYEGVTGFVTRLYSALSIFAVCSAIVLSMQVPQPAGLRCLSALSLDGKLQAHQW